MHSNDDEETTRTSNKNHNSGNTVDSISAEDNHDDDDDFSLDSQILKSSMSRNENGVQPKPSRKGGWGTDASRNDLETDFEDARLRPKTRQEEDGGAESDPDVPFIPEIESESLIVGRAEGQHAIAPQVAVNRVATYKELDNELLKHSTFLTLDNDVDLKLLAKGLSSEADLIEDDVTWKWDHLYAEVTSDLLTELENQEQGPGKTGA